MKSFRETTVPSGLIWRRSASEAIPEVSNIAIGERRNHGHRWDIGGEKLGVKQRTRIRHGSTINPIRRLARTAAGTLGSASRRASSRDRSKNKSKIARFVHSPVAIPSTTRAKADTGETVGRSTLRRSRNPRRAAAIPPRRSVRQRSRRDANRRRRSDSDCAHSVSSRISPYVRTHANKYGALLRSLRSTLSTGIRPSTGTSSHHKNTNAEETTTTRRARWYSGTR